MDSLHKKSASNQKSHVTEAAADLVNETKKYANELYEEGVNKINEAEDCVKHCSDHLLRKVQENPLTSILIAGGIGFLLSKLMRK